jgi:hypothetical protein
MIELDYWYIIGDKCFGNIKNHPTIKDGSFIITGTVKYYDKKESILTTEKCKYKLNKGYYE